MKKINNSLEDNLILEIEKLKDQRGFFRRLYCYQKFSSFTNVKIKQINHSFTKKRGTVRGLHYQIGNFKEDKFVICIQGKVFDVALDLRSKSKSFLKYKSTILSDSNNLVSFIPKGFAHGFQTLTNDVIMIYFHSNFYRASSEKIINVVDPKISIQWPLKISSISKKDRLSPVINTNFRGLK